MKKTSKLRIVGVLAVLLLVALTYFWQDITGLWRFTRAMDAEQVLAQQRGSKSYALSEACIQCHGYDGNAQHGFYPQLSAQPEAYLLNQLQAFSDGRRHHAMMSPLAMALTQEEKRLLASYYSQNKAKPSPQTALLAEASAYGRQSVTLCLSCHGEGLKGNVATLSGRETAIPRLAGQSSDYLVRQLKAFRDGSRVDPTGSMKGVASGMSDEDIVNMANYLHQFKDEAT